MAELDLKVRCRLLINKVRLHIQYICIVDLHDILSLHFMVFIHFEEY